jgi:hypothetical protein
MLDLCLDTARIKVDDQFAQIMEQLEVVLGTLDIKMDPMLYQRIAALSPTPPPATDRNEEESAHNYGSR